ncbi:MAG TPA: di-heme oxidoredictase family protein [Verrucomicrobiales bacterium]|nr:di-heme oxidoredictase family protein [Verrucomicrobiales bacterium]
MHIRIRFSKLAAPGLCLAAAAVWQVAVRATSALAQSSDSASFSEARERDDRRIQPQVLQAQVVARGIPGAGAIMQVGTFQQGGPFRDNPAFIPFTQSGAVLHHDRILVASSSNFGAPLARPAEAPGSVLSLDISSGTLAVPPNFAAGGGQATALGGAVILYVANSPAFVNGLNNPQAATAALPSASLPLGISFNNGFGRPWFANAPAGSNGYGTITVIDGNGRPLAGAPSAVAGGVFADDLTNRSPASTHGLTSAALATALITKSPDGSGRAVFLAACADGSVVQVHVEKGVDGLAPPWSFTPIQGISVASAQSNRANDITRVGMLFNWAPKRKVFVTDPLADRILVLELSDDGTLFQVARRSRLRSEWLDKPVDMAPAAVEVGTRNFASNTTPGVGSDLYILNRGNNSIVRMTQEGRVVAVGRIHSGVPGFTAGGIAVSPDARTIYVSGTTPQAGGVVLAMPAFGSGFVMDSIFANTQGGDEVAQGVEIFSLDFTEMEGLGPAFNEQSCARCHFSPAPGGMGTSQESFVVRVARIKNGRFDDLGGRGGPIARQFALPGCDVPTGVPPQANAISRRSAMTLRGTSLLDFVADRQILAVQAAQPAAVRGRQNILADGRPGRFGWKAQTATLVEFIGEAMRDEMAVTNPIAPRDLHNRCGANENSPEADGVPITALVAFLNTIDPPDPGAECLESQGAALFGSIGCAVCHTPSFAGPGRTIRAYTDLLLHNMGTGLADGFEQGSARANEFRTAPLWRVSDRSHFLHDGRAATVLEAIQTHGGQASSAVAAFNALTPAERQAILEFLDCL